MALGFGAILGGYGVARLSIPEYGDDVVVSGLSEPVSVKRDQYGIPRIESAADADAYRALGYIHAQDRMFQMEMNCVRLVRS